MTDTVTIRRELAERLLDEGRRSDTWAAQDELRTALAAPVQGEAAGMWSVAMNAAAYLEDAANCMTDQDARRAAIGAAEWVRSECKKVDRRTTPPQPHWPR